MDFLDLVKRRQSDRRFEQTAVSKELIVGCLEAARMAPSACNSQPWKFVVIDEPELRKNVARAAANMGMNRFAEEAPVIVAVVMEKMNFTARIGSVIKDKEYSLLDVGIAAEHFCLQAASMGLGTCMLGWFNEAEVNRLLKVGKRRIPLLILMGYPAGETRPKARKRLDEMSSWNKY